MQSLEGFEVAVEKRILIVHSISSTIRALSGKGADVIDLMAHAFARHAVDALLNREG
jgi:hypothetical protein